MAGPAHGAAEDSDEEDQSEHVPDSQRAEDPAGAEGEEDQSEHAPDSQRAEDPAGAGGSD